MYYYELLFCTLLSMTFSKIWIRSKSCNATSFFAYENISSLFTITPDSCYAFHLSRISQGFRCIRPDENGCKHSNLWIYWAHAGSYEFIRRTRTVWIYCSESIHPNVWTEHVERIGFSKICRILWRSYSHALCTCHRYDTGVSDKKASTDVDFNKANVSNDKNLKILWIRVFYDGDSFTYLSKEPLVTIASIWNSFLIVFSLFF